MYVFITKGLEYNNFIVQYKYRDLWCLTKYIHDVYIIECRKYNTHEHIWHNNNNYILCISSTLAWYKILSGSYMVKDVRLVMRGWVNRFIHGTFIHCWRDDRRYFVMFDTDITKYSLTCIFKLSDFYNINYGITDILNTY